MISNFRPEWQSALRVDYELVPSWNYSITTFCHAETFDELRQFLLESDRALPLDFDIIVYADSYGGWTPEGFFKDKLLPDQPRLKVKLMVYPPPQEPADPECPCIPISRFLNRMLACL